MPTPPPIPDWLLAELRKLEGWSEQFAVPPRETRELKLELQRLVSRTEEVTAANRATLRRALTLPCFWAASTWPGRQAHIDGQPLSHAGQQGLRWARRLADTRNAGASYADAAAALAAEVGVDVSTLWLHVAQARRELFGDLTVGGIHARARAAVRAPKKLPPVVCPRCGEPLPARRTVRRQFCGRSRCKVAALRERRRM